MGKNIWTHVGLLRPTLMTFFVFCDIPNLYPPETETDLYQFELIFYFLLATVLSFLSVMPSSSTRKLEWSSLSLSSLFSTSFSIHRPMKLLWWTQKPFHSKKTIHQQQTQGKNLVFEWNLSNQRQISRTFNHTIQAREESKKHAITIPVPSICLELGNIDPFTSHLKNVIPPRHSNLR